MTEEFACLGVVCECKVAAAAPHDVSAVAALDHAAAAPAIEVEYHLLACLDSPAYPAAQSAAEDAAVALLKLPAQVYDLYRGLRSRAAGTRAGHGCYAIRQLEQTVSPVDGAGIGHNVRCRGAQDDHRAGKLRQLQGRLPGVIARRVVLLVGGLVLFVDDYQPQVRLGRKDGAARAYRHTVTALLYAPPLVEPLPRGQAAVLDGHLAREAAAETVDGLRGQGQLRRHHDSPLSPAYGVGKGAEIHLRFPAAGDAVEQENMGGWAVYGALYRAHAALLVWGENGRVVRREDSASERVAIQAHVHAAHQVLCLQPPNDGGAELPDGRGAEHGPVLLLHVAKEGGLPGRQAIQCGFLLIRVCQRRKLQVYGVSGPHRWVTPLRGHLYKAPPRQ